MQLDYITIKLIHDEIRESIAGTFIRDIISHGPRDIVFVVKSSTELNLLISADPDNSRIHLIGSSRTRGHFPDDHFHRTVRHHIAGGTIEDFSIVDGERIIEIHVLRKEFSGDIRRYKFIAELMGRHSNLILVDEQDTIITSDRTQVAGDVKQREIRPGKVYQYPSSGIRLPLDEYSLDDFRKFMLDSDQDKPWGKLFISSFKGVTPGFVKVIADNAGLSENLKLDEIDDHMTHQLHKGYSKAIQRLNSGGLFPPFDSLIKVPEDISGKEKFPLNKSVEKFFESEITDKNRASRTNQWKQACNARIKSLRRLVDNLSEDQKKAKKSDEYRKIGDLIYAFINEFKPGIPKVEVDDIIDPDSTGKITIELLPGKDAVATAREYHKRASRLGRGYTEITPRLEKSREELAQFEFNLEPSDQILDLDDNEFEKMIQQIKSGKKLKLIPTGKKQAKSVDSSLPKKLQGLNIHCYRSKEGHDIYVGGNETANEALYKWGNPDDYWLHVKNIPGSHVLVPKRGETIEIETLVFAAQLAVYYSRVRGATKVPVDYTLVKYVKKPPASPAGYVIYSKEKNILADSPDEKELKKRQAK
jgi:predicted ribosome quality control (RQC) complex YloA/Tae2 family protein